MLHATNIASLEQIRAKQCKHQSYS